MAMTAMLSLLHDPLIKLRQGGAEPPRPTLYSVVNCSQYLVILKEASSKPYCVLNYEIPTGLALHIEQHALRWVIAESISFNLRFGKDSKAHGIY